MICVTMGASELDGRLSEYERCHKLLVNYELIKKAPRHDIYMLTWYTYTDIVI